MSGRTRIKDRRPWSPAQNDLLRLHFPAAAWEELERLLGRPRTAIQARAQALGLRRARTERPKGIKSRVWSAEEDDFLRANWGEMTPGEIATRLRRTPKAVQKHAELLKIVSRKSARRPLLFALRQDGEKAVPEVRLLLLRHLAREGPKRLHDLAEAGLSEAARDIDRDALFEYDGGRWRPSWVGWMELERSGR